MQNHLKKQECIKNRWQNRVYSGLPLDLPNHGIPTKNELVFGNSPGFQHVMSSWHDGELNFHRSHDGLTATLVAPVADQQQSENQTFCLCSLCLRPHFSLFKYFRQNHSVVSNSESREIILFCTHWKNSGSLSFEVLQVFCAWEQRLDILKGCIALI